jgi:phage tail sheath protein FI
VYIEEIPSGVHTITGVATSITAFIGRALRGPVNKATTIESYADFERIFGGLWLYSTLGYAVQDFFNNGGSTAVIVRLFSPTNADLQTAKDTANTVANVVDTAQTPTVATLAATIRKEADKAQTKAARLAGDAVASAAEAEANRPNLASVRKAATDTSDTINNTTQTVISVTDPTTPSTPVSLAKAMRDAAKTFATDPAKTIADLVATAAEGASTPKGATIDDVNKAAKSAADAMNTVAQTVANVADTAAQSTPQTLAKAIRAEATKSAQDPAKTAADRVAVAAEQEAAYTPSIASVRQAAQNTATTYTQNLPITTATVSIGELPLVAASQGSWGENLRATIDINNITKDVANAIGVPQNQLFNLTVTDDSPGGRTEQFRTLTVIDHPRRIDRVLYAQSQLLRWGNFDSNGKLIPPTDKDMPTFPAGTNAVSDSITLLELTLAAAQKQWRSDRNLGKARAILVADKQAVDTDQQTLDTAKAKLIISDGDPITENEFVGPGTAENKWGLFALEQVDLFNLLCIPPYLMEDPENLNVDSDLIAVAAAYCEQRRAMLLVDAPSDWIDKNTAIQGFTQTGVGTTSKNAALFFPRIMRPNILRNNQLEPFVPCGVVAGIFARTDAGRGVWKAPAGLEASLVGVPQLTVNLTDAENGDLNQLGVNCLRSFPIYGRVVWGSRTLRGADAFADEYKYIPVRRTALFIEESLYRGTQWVVFEPNDEPLWAQIRLNVGAFMHNLFRQGAFQGQTPRDAYLVKCDSETTTQNDINLGIVNILVAFAPLKPAEFVIIQIQQLAGQIQV